MRYRQNSAKIYARLILTFEEYRAGRIRPKRQFWFPFSPTYTKRNSRRWPM